MRLELVGKTFCLVTIIQVNGYDKCLFMQTLINDAGWILPRWKIALLLRNRTVRFNFTFELNLSLYRYTYNLQQVIIWLGMKIYILALCVCLGSCRPGVDPSQLLMGTLVKQGETAQDALEGFPDLPIERKKVDMYGIKMIWWAMIIGFKLPNVYNYCNIFFNRGKK